MKLAVIGSGNIGKSIGSWAAKVGYEVIFSAKNEAHAIAAAKEAGNGASAATIENAVSAAELVLFAAPYGAAQEILPALKAALNGKTLIDATNALAADFSGLTVGFTSSAAEEIAKLVPGVKVVKAFNTVFAQVYASQNPSVNGTKISVFVAGDDAAAKKSVVDLVSALGFDAVDAGPLAASRNIEPLAMLNISLGYGMGYGTSVGFTFNR